MNEKEKKLNDLPKCSQNCMSTSSACSNEQCSHWINYETECNCDLISIFLNGPMSLRQIGERIGISYVRVKQIEDAAIKKIKEQSFDMSQETI